MPIYSNKCIVCEIEKEFLQKMGEKPPLCNECGSRMIRTFSKAPSFILKGGGWAKDNYSKPIPKPG